MKFEPKNIYHVYNQGNNHERLFLNPDNYKHFLNLFKNFVLPYTEVLAWCLMPNHFHYMLYTDERCSDVKQQGNLRLDPVTNGFRKLLSTYSHEFNKKNGRSGALFKPKTKSKCLSDESFIIDTKKSFSDYNFNCFYYIHNNPVKDGLVKLAADWEWSSYNFYYGSVIESFCNKSMAARLCLYNEDNKGPDHNLINYIN
jgi:REP element-mobilizing transposase RayT